MEMTGDCTKRKGLNMNTENSDDTLLNVKALATMLGVHPVTLRRIDYSGKLPKPLRLAAHCIRWRTGEIRAWMDAGCPGRERWEMIQGK